MGGDQELCTKLQCGTADRADGSAEVASEIVKHLK
jgi:predicted small metal-binding protein